MNSQNPKVPKSKLALFQIELRTGIVLDLSGQRRLGKEDWFLLFDSLEEAKRHAEVVITRNPEIECVIQDDQNRNIATIRDERYVQAILDQARKAREQRCKWWKFW